MVMYGYVYVWLFTSMYGCVWLCRVMYGYVEQCGAMYYSATNRHTIIILTNVKPLYDAYTTYLCMFFNEKTCRILNYLIQNVCCIAYCFNFLGVHNPT